MNTKKIIVLGLFTMLIGAQCWGAGNTQEELNGALFKAARKGDTAAVQTLLAQRACVNATDNKKNDRTALHCAAGKGKADTVLALLAAKACVDTKDQNGLTALYCAASTRYAQIAEVVKLLLDNNASVNTCSEWGKPVLHAAAGNGHADTVLALLMARAYVDTTYDTGAGGTALHEAAFWGHDKAVRVLIDNGASIYVVYKDNDASYFGGDTPLHQAAGRFKVTVISALIDAHYNELIKRCPVIIDMGNGYMGNQEQVILSREILECIIKNFSAHEFANFRFVCKYFRMFVCEQFENVRKKRAVQLKENFIEYIEPTLDRARNVCPEDNYGEDRKKATIDLLTTELERANGLDIDGLLRGEIICNGSRRLAISQTDSDLGSQVVIME